MLENNILNLSKNRWRYIFKYQENPSDFKILNLSENSLAGSNLTKFQIFEFVENLNFSSNSLDGIGFQIILTKFPKLKTLDISQNKFENILEITQKHNFLEKLNISDNLLTGIVFNKSLVFLKELNISNNKLNIIGTEINNSLQNIEYLDISFNLITQYFYKENKRKNRIDLTRMKNLKELKANNNKIENVAFLSNHPKLEKIFLNDNKISNIPSLYGLISLKYLNVKYFFNNSLIKNSNNNIEALENICCLFELETLEIQGNKLKSASLIKSQLKFCQKLANVNLLLNPCEEAYSELSKFQNSQLNFTILNQIESPHNPEEHFL